MKRSFGVTFSAVIVFIGCAFTLLACALFAVGLAALSISPQESAQNLPRFTSVFGIFFILFGFAFVAWGIACGVGLLRLRPWARISMLVYGGLLLVFTVPALMMFLFMPSSVFSQPNMPENFGLFMRVFFLLIYGSIAALGGVWLWFFKTRAVKAEFQAQQPEIFDPQAGYSPGNYPLPASVASSSSRPVGVTIIGIFLLIGGVFSMFLWPLYRVMFPELRPYGMFFGLFLRDFPAVLSTMVVAGATAAAGWGLLKLKNWARLLTICLQVITVFNIAITFLIPASRAHFTAILDEYQAAAMKSLPGPNGTRAALPGMQFSVWVGMAWVLPIAVVIVWYLITRKRVFIGAAEKAASGD